ncbi:MAG: DUF308 domain-containing protein [Anaeroplasmataceae bacterium]|nr:DUF308 domain-containing protein [Anaeroplasmataceae bacterium]
MKNLMNMIFYPKKTKWFWTYIVLGILGIILGIMLMPVWSKCPDWVFWKDWGTSIINMIICACLVLYLCLYLIKKILTRSNGVIKILTIIEFVMLSLVALGCVLQQFKVFSFVNGACAILGMAMWCRGVVEIFRAYYHQHGNNDRYPVWWLVISICLVTIGVYFVLRPPFSDIVILWVFVVFILLISIILIVDGFLAKPTTKKTKKVKETNKKAKK